jgi:hypothetical protein
MVEDVSDQRRKRWLWAIVAPMFVVYRIATPPAADVFLRGEGSMTSRELTAVIMKSSCYAPLAWRGMER